jgi:hypothetical protein
VITAIPDMPAGTVGFEATGEVSAADYEQVLAPGLRAAIDAGGVRLLYLLGEGFESYSAGAFVQDAKLWFGHLSGWERVAVVSDHDWIVNGVTAFAWMMPGEVSTFPTAELEAAKAWVAGTG